MQEVFSLNVYNAKEPVLPSLQNFGTGFESALLGWIFHDPQYRVGIFLIVVM